MKKQPLAERAIATALTQKGVHELGTSNWGPQVSKYLKSTGITFGAAWCMAFVHWCFEQSGTYLGGGASVGNFTEWARKHGEIVSRPFRGDVVAFQFDQDNWPDHVGIVLRVVALGPVLTLRTVEGNTSSGTGGSQADGGGVHIRTRVVRRNRVIFARIAERKKPLPKKRAPVRKAKRTAKKTAAARKR